MRKTKRQDEEEVGSEEAQPTKTAQRRRFILEQVERHGQVTFEAIATKGRELGFSTAWQSLKTDDQLFEHLGLHARMQQKRFVLKGRDIAPIYEGRQEEQQLEKRAIGQFAGVLLWGTRSSGEREGELDRGTIVTQLKAYAGEGAKKYGLSPKAQQAGANLLRRLEAYWSKHDRYCAIDAGTTTTELGEYLCNRRAPDKNAGLVSLTVVTNAPPIEQKLLKSSGSIIDILSLGGFLNKDTHARAGMLCELAIKRLEFPVDVAVVGTTTLVVDVEERKMVEGFACDSQDEAKIKSLLLGKADIRCVVMDSGKFMRPRSAAFVFAPLSSQFVDLVITDEGVFDQSSRDRNEAWHRLWDAGIVVLYLPGT